jgi:hypothetical protein
MGVIITSLVELEVASTVEMPILPVEYSAVSLAVAEILPVAVVVVLVVG